MTALVPHDNVCRNRGCFDESNKTQVNLGGPADPGGQSALSVPLIASQHKRKRNRHRHCPGESSMSTAVPGAQLTEDASVPSHSSSSSCSSRTC
eukprot:scaffold6366_cov14-Tisochrysis_lutea.AAC.1